MGRYFTDAYVTPARDVVIEPDAEELAAIAEWEKARQIAQAALDAWVRVQEEVSDFWRLGSPDVFDRAGNARRDQPKWEARRDAVVAKEARARQARDDATEAARRASVRKTKLGQRRTWRVAMATSETR